MWFTLTIKRALFIRKLNLATCSNARVCLFSLSLTVRTVRRFCRFYSTFYSTFLCCETRCRLRNVQEVHNNIYLCRFEANQLLKSSITMPPKRKAAPVKEKEAVAVEVESDESDSMINKKDVVGGKKKGGSKKAVDDESPALETVNEPVEAKRGRKDEEVVDDETNGDTKPKKRGRKAKADKNKKEEKEEEAVEENGDSVKPKKGKKDGGDKNEEGEGEAEAKPNVDVDVKTNGDAKAKKGRKGKAAAPAAAAAAPASPEAVEDEKESSDADDANDDGTKAKKARKGKAAAAAAAAPTSPESVEDEKENSDADDAAVEDKIDDDEELEVPAPPSPAAEPKEKEKKGGRGKKALAASKKEDKDADEEPPKRNKRQVKAAPVYEENSDESEGEKPSKKKSKKQPAAEQKGRGRGRPKKVNKDVEDEDSDGDDVVEEEKPKGKGRPKKEAAAPSASKSSEALMNPTDTDYEKIDFSCKKENALGKEPNFVISSWNVDGLRAWLKKDGLKYLEHEKPDVFCIQESKCAEDKLPDEIKDLEGYEQYWQNSEKEGYAGVALFSRTKPLDVKYGIGDEEHDEEGRCVTAEFEKFYVVSVYVPNAGRKLVTLPKRLEWNKAFKTYIKELDKSKPVIVCGDMNVAHGEIDLANPKTNTKNAGFTKEEREGMTEFLGDGYVDTYRKFYPDKTGAYTFWTYMMKSRSKNVGWRLDYFIVSERFVDNICDNIIRSDVLGSDHCPITLFLNV